MSEKTTLRSHSCGCISPSLVGESITLCGWVRRHRDLGHLIFIDLWDRYGTVQLAFKPESEAHKQAGSLKFESTIQATGTLQKRASPNPHIPNGDLELAVDKITLFSGSSPLPFELNQKSDDVSEEVRLKHRYLDIRRGKLLDNLQMRHKATLYARNFLNDKHFLEIQTPLLSKSSPEGARDYLVPSRIYPGSFYALPQSPQIFKQLLMVGGCDRYFQIAPCFRDEDLRADRQPEFSQIDIEMSFASREDLFALAEGLVQSIFKKTLELDIPKTFERLTYSECMRRFGTDKPDMRFGMELQDLSDLLGRSDSAIFQKTLESQGIIKGIVVPGGSSLSRKEIDRYTELAKSLGLGGLAWVKHEAKEIKSPLLKFFDSSIQSELRILIEEGGLLLIGAGEKPQVYQTLDHLRRLVAHEKDMIPKNVYRFLWVIDFPMFEWDSVEERYYAMHHPFTAPLASDIDEPAETMRSSGYDLVVNGYEVAGGSERIYNSDLQQKVFRMLGISEQESEDKFGYLLKALKLGAPPHLGIAFGLERLIMLLVQTDHIRDVIAFPKTTKAADLMMQAPSIISKNQLDELNLSMKKN